jgi:hypothetical protein
VKLLRREDLAPFRVGMRHRIFLGVRTGVHGGTSVLMAVLRE